MKKTKECISTLAEKEWSGIVGNFSENLNSENAYRLYAKKRREFVKRYKELPTSESENNHLLSLKNKYKDKRIFLIGSGPSLNNTPLELLEGEYTFGVNRIYLLFDRINWRPTFYTVNDWEVGPDNALEINELEGMTFFFPTRFRGLFKEKPNTYWYNSRNRRGKDDVFNYDLTDGAVMGGTVMSLVLQIAYFMGFDPVYLIGIDVDYKINKTVSQDGKLFPNGNKQFFRSTVDDDPNHFDSRYFGKGRRWHNPNVENMIDGFVIARKAFEDKGRRIYNATVGGKLEAFERVDFNSLFRKTKTKPTVSVIMPAYNAEKYINNAIRSVINQTFSNWELIIVNDGSTDGTQNIISSYNDSRIICINQENKGRAEARNAALRHAQGEYIAFLDADDLYLPTKLETQLKFFADNKSADIVVGGFNRISQNGHVIRQSLQQDTKKISIKSFFLGCPANIIATMIRRNAIDGHRFDPNARAGEDWDFWLRLAIKDFQFYKQNEIVGCYRLTDQAIKKTSKQYATHMVGVLDRVFSELPADSKYSKYKNEAYIQTNMRMAARLFSTEQYDQGKLFFEAAASFTDKHNKKFYRIAANQISFWLKHIDADRPENYIKQIIKVLQNKFDTTQLSKYCYDSLSIKDNSCITEPPRSKMKETVASGQKEIFLQHTGLNNAKGIKLPFIKRLYRRFANYTVDNYPALGRIGLFGVWSLRTLKVQMRGLGGITFLCIAGLFTAAYFFEDIRLLLNLTGGGLALLLVGVFGVAYARYLFRSIREIQQNELNLQITQAIDDTQAIIETRFKSEVQKVHKKLNQVVKESEQQAGKELQVLRDQLEKKEVQTKKTIEKLHKESRQALEKSQRAIAAHMGIISKANFLNAGIYQRFNRYLQKEHSQKILDFWCPTLALEELDRRALGYLAHRICQVENNCSGRLAASIEDAVLRTLVAQSIRSKKLEILEIGSLFGIGLAVIYDSCRGRFDGIHLTAIDPLEGYYKKSAYDFGTKAPINRTLFEHNMRIADIPKKSVSLIQALSTEKKAQEAAAKRSYSILIIDGDHSYDGVKFDFENYHQMVKREGYIIFDDYNSKEWPDVTEFVDNEVRKRSDVKLLGSDWRTAVFKVAKKQNIIKAISK